MLYISIFGINCNAACSRDNIFNDHEEINVVFFIIRPLWKNILIFTADGVWFFFGIRK